jgi:hypothetical protein
MTSIYKNRWFIPAYVMLWSMVVGLIAGIYYERYEALFSALASGQLTPGMPYDDFFYLAHIFTIRAYATLYSSAPNTHWLGWFQAGYMLIVLGAILSAVSHRSKSSLFFWTGLIVISLFFADHLVYQVYTRVSYMLGFAALLLTCVRYESGSLGLSEKALYTIVFLLGSLTRPEPAAMMLLVVAPFHFLMVSRQSLWNRIWESVRLFAPMAAIPLAVFVWMQMEIGKSDRFYKQIEPEVEYELTARNNIVPISSMGNARDSMRYTAIDRVVWGDASTNDAAFLRSLIGGRETDPQVEGRVRLTARSSLTDSMLHNPAMVLLACFLLLAVLIVQLAQRDHRRALGTLAFILFFILLMLLVSYRIKMTPTAVACVFFSVAALTLVFFGDGLLSAGPRRLIVLSGLGALSVFQAVQLHGHADTEKARRRYFRTAWGIMGKNFTGKNILLNGESIHLLNAFSPLRPFDFEPFNKVIIYDSQHVSTMEPYRTYLANDCNCDPNNYAEYFAFLQEGGASNIFLMSADFRRFLEKYLYVVHGTQVSFSPALNVPIMKGDTPFVDDDIFAYTIDAAEP